MFVACLTLQGLADHPSVVKVVSRALKPPPAAAPDAAASALMTVFTTAPATAIKSLALSLAAGTDHCAAVLFAVIRLCPSLIRLSLDRWRLVDIQHALDRG